MVFFTTDDTKGYKCYFPCHISHVKRCLSSSPCNLRVPCPRENQSNQENQKTVTKMYGWILKTDWDIERVMKWYSRRRGKTSWREI